MNRVGNPQKPVIRVDNWLLFPGGKYRKMTWRERMRARYGTLYVRR